MASPLERWRERCCKFLASNLATGAIITNPRLYKMGTGVARAHDTSVGETNSAVVIAALEKMNAKGSQKGPIKEGLRLALAWLREEVERGE